MATKELVGELRAMLETAPAAADLAKHVLLPTVQNLGKYLDGDDPKAKRAGLKMMLSATAKLLAALGEDEAAKHLEQASTSLKK